MSEYITNNYHQSSLHFLLNSYKNQRKNNADQDRESIENMDMYWRPIQETSEATFFLIIRLIFIIGGELLQMQALSMTKKENSVCVDVFEIFLYVQMVYWPIEVIFITLTDWFYPLFELLGGMWICDLVFFVKYIMLFIILFHSFCIALIRYIYLFHYKFIESKGKEKVKRVFSYMLVSVAMVTTLWKYFGSGELDMDPYMNKCRGVFYKEFLLYALDSSSTSHNAMNAAEKFCVFEHDGGNIEKHVIAMVRRISCIASSVMFVFMGLNVTEGFLYLTIIIHVRR